MPTKPRPDETLIRALARAHRWKRLLEEGRYRSVAELAEAEKINRAYVCRLLNLALLDPEISEAVLDGRQPADLALAALMKPIPVEWHVQQRVFGFGQVAVARGQRQASTTSANRAVAN
jgi:hypothetical protein